VGPRRVVNSPRFRVLGVLGEGGGGIVERVFDAQRRGEVAVKRLRQTNAVHEEALRREHRLLAGLHHPNLLCPLELGRDERGLFLVTEFVPSDDFVRHCTGSLARLAGALPQLLAALRYLHERGFVHGDISPGNVRVRPDGRLVVMDFGLGGVESPRGGLGIGAAHGGTPGFIAPERVEGGPPTAASDLYSLGCLLRAATARDAVVAVDEATQALLGPAAQRPSARELEGHLLRSLGAVAVNSSANPTRREGLVGRGALVSVVTGELLGGAWVVLRGPSGVGKTAVMGAVAGRVREAGLLLLAARGRHGAHAPFELLDLWLTEAAPHLGRCPASGPLTEAAERLGVQSPAIARWAGADPHALRTRATLRARLFGSAPGRGAQVADDVRTVLSSLGRRVVLLADDLHWGDEDSVALLGSLARNADGEFGLLATSVPGELSLADVSTVDVSPLGESTVVELLVAAGLTEDRAREVAALAGGLPAVALLAARFATDARPLAAAVTDLVRGLGRQEHEVLAALCAAGRPVDRADLDANAVGALEGRGLVAMSAGGIDFAHGVLVAPIGEALGADWVGAARLRRAEDPALDTAERVDAWLAAGRVDEARALAPEAAESAFRRGAYRRAAELYEVAAHGTTDRGLREHLAVALDASQQHGRAASEWESLADLSAGDRRQEYGLARARSLLSARRIDEGRRVVAEALGAPAPAWRSLARFLRGPRVERPILGRAAAERALRNASLAGYFNTFEGVRLALDARSAFGPGADELGAWTDYLLAFYARFAGLPRLARRYRRAGDARNVSDSRPLVHVLPGFLDAYELQREGDYAGAVRGLDAGLDALRGSPDALSFEGLLGLSLRTSAVLARQRVTEAEAAVALFEAAARDGRDIAVECHVDNARALVLTWQGRFEEAVTLLARARVSWPAEPRTLQLVLIEVYAALPRVLLGEAVGARADLRRVLERRAGLYASAYGPIVAAIVAMTELAAARAGDPGASVPRAIAYAAFAVRRPSFANGLGRRVLCYATGRGFAGAEEAARARDQPLDRALAMHARGQRTPGAAGTRLQAQARGILADAGASPRLLDEGERLA